MMLPASHNEEHTAGFERAGGPIVVAVSETPCTDTLGAATRLAEKQGCELSVATVIEPASTARLDTTRAPLNTRLDDMVNERRAVVHAALQHFRASLRTECPVLAVRQGTSGFQRVVVAVDFSAESVHAALEAMRLLGDDAQLHLVHVWKRITKRSAIESFTSADAEYERALPERFLRMRAILESTRSVRITTEVCEGEPVREVLRSARARNAQLVVAGMRGYDALERTLLGSVSTALLRKAACSVMLAPGPDITTRSDLTRLMEGSFTDLEPSHWAGVTYDRRDQRVAMMFGAQELGHPHTTHSVGGVQNISMTCSKWDHAALCIEGDGSRVILQFADVP